MDTHEEDEDYSKNWNLTKVSIELKYKNIIVTIKVSGKRQMRYSPVNGKLGRKKWKRGRLE